MGGALGFGAWVGINVPKAVLDVAAAFAGLFGFDTRPVRLVKGLVDTGLGGFAIYDVATKPKDDFWKGFEWVFGVLEALSGGLTAALAMADYMTGALGWESFDFKMDERVVELLTGKRTR